MKVVDWLDSLLSGVIGVGKEKLQGSANLNEDIGAGDREMYVIFEEIELVTDREASFSRWGKVKTIDNLVLLIHLLAPQRMMNF